MRIQDHEDIVYAFDEFLKSGQCKSLWDIKSKWKQLLSEYNDIQETKEIDRLLESDMLARYEPDTEPEHDY